MHLMQLLHATPEGWELMKLVWGSILVLVSLLAIALVFARLSSRSGKAE
jgi:hypothetical protein